MFGTSWYERGFGYWVRRVLMVVIGAGILALIFAAFQGVYNGIRQDSAAGASIALIVQTVYSLAVIVFFAVRAKRRWHTRVTEPPRFRMPANPLAKVGYVVAQILQGVAIVVCFGLYAFLFLATLTPETIYDRPARLRMADLLRSRGL